MPVKRRKPKARRDPMVEAKYWAEYFDGGSFLLAGWEEPLGMEWINPNETERIAERDLEVRKVAEDAWRRLGALYLKTATGHAHWALREFGTPKNAG